MALLLVRHAHALARAEWDGDDLGRQLSVKGHRQAAALVAVLAEFKPARLLSSPYLRCLDTLRPLADHLGSVVEPDGRLAEGSGRAAVDLVRALANDRVVLCTHGDVIPDVLKALADQDHVDLGVRPQVEKGSVWVLEGDGQRFTTALYLPPRTRTELAPAERGPTGMATGSLAAAAPPLGQPLRQDVVVGGGPAGDHCGRACRLSLRSGSC